LNNELNTAIDTDWYPAAEKCYAASSFTSADYRAFAVKFHAGGLEYAKAKRLLASFGVR